MFYFCHMITFLIQFQSDSTPDVTPRAPVRRRRTLRETKVIDANASSAEAPSHEANLPSVPEPKTKTGDTLTVTESLPQDLLRMTEGRRSDRSPKPPRPPPPKKGLKTQSPCVSPSMTRKVEGTQALTQRGPHMCNSFTTDDLDLGVFGCELFLMLFREKSHCFTAVCSCIMVHVHT